MQNTSFICLVQEPMTDKNRAIFQPNSCQIFCKGKNPRASIYLSTSIKAWYMESLSTPDMTVVQMKLNNRSTLIVSVYMDINNTAVIPDELDKVMDYVNQKGLAIIIGADTNAHSTNYGPTGNTRGDKVDLFTAQQRLSIENKGDTATFHGRGCNTFIDATFTSKLSVSIKDWKVCTDYNGSDHNTILFNTDIEYEQVLPQWQWHKADWDTFSAELQKADIDLPHIIYQVDCDEIVNKYYKLLYKAMKIAIPKSKTKLIDKNNPWWTPGLQTRRKQVNKLYRI